jgi:hypothetical protein
LREKSYVNAMNSLMLGPQGILRMLDMPMHYRSILPLASLPPCLASLFEEVLPSVHEFMGRHAHCIAEGADLT